MVRKIKKYQQLLQQLLVEETPTKYAPDIDFQILTDLKNNHFQLIEVGWEDLNFVYRTLIYCSIKPNGKIWIWVNNTDSLIAEELVKKCVAASDIVLGFHSVSVRPYTGFAVA